MHDINLTHLLGALGYYRSFESEKTQHIPGVDYNSSLRFEVMEKEMTEDSSLDDKPITYVRMYLDDLPLPCNEKKATICPLTPFI